MKATVVGLFLAVAFSGQAIAATVDHFTSKEGREVITLSSGIIAGDASQVANAIKEANAAGRLVSAVRLNSPGGSLDEGAKLADVVRYAKIATVVMNGTSCASACFIVFAAGSEKYASYSANVGVHGASVNGQETEGSRAATIAMAKIVKELGVPPAIIGQMVVTPPNQIVWLQPADLQSMGVTMTGAPRQPGQITPPPVVPQQTVPDGSPPSTPLGLIGGLVSSVPPSRNELWGQLVKKTITQASYINPGASPLSRVCQPEYKSCVTAVFGKSDNGKPLMVRVTENIDGQMIARDVCTFNDFSDIRQCMNWDTGATTREMKDAAGRWSSVTTQ